MSLGASCMLPVGVERGEGGVLVGAGCSSCAAANISAPRQEKSASSGGGGGVGGETHTL